LLIGHKRILLNPCLSFSCFVNDNLEDQDKARRIVLTLKVKRCELDLNGSQRSILYVGEYMYLEGCNLCYSEHEMNLVLNTASYDIDVFLHS
jgi:hypothetical protein